VLVAKNHCGETRRWPTRAMSTTLAALASLFSAHVYPGPHNNTADQIWARHVAACVKAEGTSSSPPLAPWLSAARSTFDRVRVDVLKTSMVDPVRLLATAQLAHRSIAVEGDFIETGVANGGSSILMMAVLDDANARKRHFACDSFQGLPAGMPQDWNGVSKCSSYTRSEGPMSGAMSCGYHGNVGLAQTMKSFRGQFRFARKMFEDSVQRSGVSRERLNVVEGWFNETLPPKTLDRIAFLRLDGDLYASTHDALSALYHRVTPGGAVYVDDYGAFGGCRLAVDQFRERHGITSPMARIWTNFTPLAHKSFTPHTRGGYGFEGVWWIK